MERLQKSGRFLEGNAPSYLRTHPITFERIAEAQSRAEATPYKQVARLARLPSGARAAAQLPGRGARGGRASSRSRCAERKFNSEVAVRYGLVAALAAREELQAREKRARACVEKMAPPHPMIEAMGAHVLLEAGEIDAGDQAHRERAARATRARCSSSTTIPKRCLRAKRPAEAAAFIESQLLRFPGDGRLHRTAARAYADLDKRLKQHYHQGEFYAWRGRPARARSCSASSRSRPATRTSTRVRSSRRGFASSAARVAEQQKEGFGRTAER